jgi:hypothetical protein
MYATKFERLLKTERDGVMTEKIGSERARERAQLLT